jgi:hypothetical protein
VRRLLIGCLGAVLLVSCGDAAGDPTTTSEAGTSTSSTGSTTTSVPASTTAPPIPVLSDLTGDWENERAVLPLKNEAKI